jgi:predicted transcriptional regulator
MTVERLTITIDSDLKNKLDIYCFSNKKNMSSILRESLRIYFDGKEDELIEAKKFLAKLAA